MNHEFCIDSPNSRKAALEDRERGLDPFVGKASGSNPAAQAAIRIQSGVRKTIELQQSSLQSKAIDPSTMQFSVFSNTSATKESIMHSQFFTALISRTAFATSLLAAAISPALAYDSGSTGADGALSPTVNTVVTLPASGVLNYTTVNIPTGVTVTFAKNTINTPVTILASGNVTIAGTIDVSGKASPNVGAAGDGNVGDDGQPGVGGTGGYDGGRGGLAGSKEGGTGLGPGGGGRGYALSPNACYARTTIDGGSGGGFATATAVSNFSCMTAPAAGVAYGAAQLLPLVGGSGGGGGGGGSAFAASGGGGGGGAVLIASSGTVSVTGSILAKGGASGASSGGGLGSTGGGGSGGAIRIVATTIAGNGPIDARGGGAGAAAGTGVEAAGTAGADGRIRLESETYTRTAATTPSHSFGAPGTAFIAGLPSVKITSVAGQSAPANPTGIADVTLPITTPAPMTVTFATTGVPVGNTITLTVSPAYGVAVSALSTAITGSTSSGTASASVTLPQGASTLSATIAYTVVP